MSQLSKRSVKRAVITGVVAAPIVLIIVIVLALSAKPSSIEPAAGEPAAEKQAECTYPKEWIGKPADEKAIKKEAKVFRVLGPDSAATMDFNPERLNVMTDEDGVVKEVTCG